MKQYIQITAGRGPVECARSVTLVAREIVKAIPSLQLADCEPHNQVEGCYMSMTFVSGVLIPETIVKEWQGTVYSQIVGGMESQILGKIAPNCGGRKC